MAGVRFTLSSKRVKSVPCRGPTITLSCDVLFVFMMSIEDRQSLSGQNVSLPIADLPLTGTSKPIETLRELSCSSTAR